MLIQINTLNPAIRRESGSYPLYQIFLLPDPVEVIVDFTHYSVSSTSLLFLSPYQHLEWRRPPVQPVSQILFHGDFYCIEYHKKEVACNGLLFNNIYLQPFVTVSAETYREIKGVIDRMNNELGAETQFSASVVKAYLQLILALSSKAKKQQLDVADVADAAELREGAVFQQLLEAHFLTEKSVNFYANELNLSADAFSRKIKRQLGKLPSMLIRERIVLESKKLLHLTYLSIKEIALKLHFDDVHYFSRYFKKEVGVSPSEFRTRVGISIAATK